MVEHHDVEEGVTSPRTLSGATAIAILEAAALQRLPRPRRTRRVEIKSIVNKPHEKEETIANLAKTGPAELKRTVSDQPGRRQRIQPADAGH